jgi:peptide/nickel transport system permease protein
MRRNLGKFFSHWQNILGLSIVALYLFIAVGAPVLAPSDPLQVFSPYKLLDKRKGRVPLPPGTDALMGTLPTGSLGRQIDVFFTIVWGTRSALKFGLSVAFGAALIGVSLGAISAYMGGMLDTVIMRFTDAFLAVPVIVGVVMFQQFLLIINDYALRYRFDNNLGAETPLVSPLQVILTWIDPVMLALILFSWMAYARLTHTMVVRLKNTEFIEAAHALGAKPLQVVFRHLIPNAISPSIVLAARDIGGVVLLQATLTFIGLGGNSEWGTMLSMARRWIVGPGGNPLIYWWVFVPATLALVLFGIGWNLLGDGLNDWLDPTTR